MAKAFAPAAAGLNPSNPARFHRAVLIKNNQKKEYYYEKDDLSS